MSSVTAIVLKEAPFATHEQEIGSDSSFGPFAVDMGSFIAHRGSYHGNKDLFIRNSTMQQSISLFC